MTARAQRIAELEDILGDASACSDEDCSCKRGVHDAREELDALSADATEEVVILDWCAAGNHYVNPATTQPYEPGSRFRYCPDCAREWIPIKAAGADENELRQLAGGR